MFEMLPAYTFRISGVPRDDNRTLKRTSVTSRGMKTDVPNHRTTNGLPLWNSETSLQDSHTPQPHPDDRRGGQARASHPATGNRVPHMASPCGNQLPDARAKKFPGSHPPSPGLGPLPGTQPPALLAQWCPFSNIF